MDSEATKKRSDGSVAFQAWFEVNKKRLLIGVIILVFLTLGVSLFALQQSQRERSASRAFSEVRLPHNPAVAAPADSAEAFLKVANDYKGTKAATRALLTSAGLLFTEKKYAEAEARFNQVMRDYPDSPWTPEALLGVAASLDAQGKSADAITKYEEIRRRFDKSSVVDETKLALARLFETQKPEDAYKLYDELAKSPSGSRLSMQARMHQDDLLKARPELAKLKESLNPPPITSFPTPTPPPGTIQLTNQRPASTNLRTIQLTNTPTPGTSAPIQIKLSPSPTPAPGPAPVPGPGPAPAAAAPAPAPAPPK